MRLVPPPPSEARLSLTPLPNAPSPSHLGHSRRRFAAARPPRRRRPRPCRGGGPGGHQGPRSKGLAASVNLTEPRSNSSSLDRAHLSRGGGPGRHQRPCATGPRDWRGRPCARGSLRGGLLGRASGPAGLRGALGNIRTAPASALPSLSRNCVLACAPHVQPKWRARVPMECF